MKVLYSTERWRQSAIMDLWGSAFWDHPHRVLRGLYHLAKFGWNRLHALAFIPYGSSNISCLWLGNAYSRPKVVFWKIWPPPTQHPKYTSLQMHGKTSYDVQVVKTGPLHGATCARDRTKEIDRQIIPTVANWAFAQITHVVGSTYRWVDFRW